MGYLLTNRCTFIMIAVLSCCNLWADVDFQDIPKLTLKGHALLHKPADQISLTLGVVTVANDADSALKENSEKMQAVIQSIEKTGLAKDEYETGQFSIRPIYSIQPKDAPEDWRPSIKGYEVSNTIDIKTTQLKLAGDIIDAANTGGANTIDNISFGLKDPHMHRAEAIAAAASNAIDDAKALAKATSQKLIRILLISLDDAQYIAPVPRAASMFMSKSMAPGMASAPIAAGNVDVSANVTLVYETEAINEKKGNK